MHEYSIATGIVNSVLPIAEERDVEVKKVFVVAGVLRAIMPDALKFSFDAIKRRHPLLTNAELCLKTVLLHGECADCGKGFDLERPMGVCPYCGSSDVEWSGGNELFVEKIEIFTDNQEER